MIVASGGVSLSFRSSRRTVVFAPSAGAEVGCGRMRKAVPRHGSVVVSASGSSWPAPRTIQGRASRRTCSRGEARRPPKPPLECLAALKRPQTPRGQPDAQRASTRPRASLLCGRIDEPHRTPPGQGSPRGSLSVLCLPPPRRAFTAEVTPSIGRCKVKSLELESRSSSRRFLLGCLRHAHLPASLQRPIHSVHPADTFPEYVQNLAPLGHVCGEASTVWTRRQPPHRYAISTFSRAGWR